MLASFAGANVSALCAAFGISRQTGICGCGGLRPGRARSAIARDGRCTAGAGLPMPSRRGSLRCATPIRRLGVRKIVALLPREGAKRASAHGAYGFVQCRGIPAAPPLPGQALETEGFYRLRRGLPKPRPVAGQARPASL